MDSFDLTALFLVLVGVVGWVNARFFRLPNAAVMVLAGLAGAGALLLADRVWPHSAAADMVTVLARLDFSRTVMGYMLAFLLFAGAMQVDLAELRRRYMPVLSLATLGVAASTAIVGFGIWLIGRALGLELDLPWALVFGALISPTDPIAVLAAVRDGHLSKSIEVVLQGEALFNDGVGIVVFAATVALASDGGAIQPLHTLAEVLVEAVGGGLIGWLSGFLVIRAMRQIDDHAVEVGLSLALAMGAYAVSQWLHVSGAIAVVVAGLLMGDTGVRTAMSEHTQRYTKGFWTLVDEILNALLFLLLGLELLVVPFHAEVMRLWPAAILLVLVARLAVVLPWGAWFHFREREPGAAALLTWGGLHGALSLALAISIPNVPERELILSTTFAVVVFSVLVQSLTFGPLARRLAAADDPLSRRFSNFRGVWAPQPLL